jgi:hypothetical protein
MFGVLEEDTVDFQGMEREKQLSKCMKENVDIIV